ncbi:site-specific integrase [Anaerobacillus sp. CMMVII]|uniref:site-specific integrase n=1 Tax=Anaerobacillus sp. CMMVII TaxID=2755588 RepID=UPI0021B7F840|nr:site-specific integrase [Anaerobacillus sp. CMMVII]MCT8136468.1 site-specific integrase [Anaerobacillus sp. CMMVII]
MASYQKYTTKQGQLWLFKMDTGIDATTGKRQTTTRRGFKTKKEAQAVATKLKQELESGMLINNNNLTFEEVFKQWFTNHCQTIKPSTKKALQSKFKKHILPRFGKLKIKEITNLYCQKMINEIAQQIKSVNDIKIQANQVFKYALKMELITKNPLAYVSIPRSAKEMLSDDNEDTARTYWRKDEIKQFLKICKLELLLRDYALFHLLIYTGARKGELLALTWNDIDFKNATIRFSKTLTHIDGNFITQTSKTKVSKRLISIDDKSLTLLKKLRTSQLETILATKCAFDDNNMVFTRDDGTPMRLAYPNEKLDILIKKYTLHRITIHGLRHTHASLLFEAGAGIKEVQERLGHSDIQMTMNIYTHVTDTVKEQTAEKFQRYIEL